MIINDHKTDLHNVQGLRRSRPGIHGSIVTVSPQISTSTYQYGMVGSCPTMPEIQYRVLPYRMAVSTEFLLLLIPSFLVISWHIISNRFHSILMGHKHMHHTILYGLIRYTGLVLLFEALNSFSRRNASNTSMKYCPGSRCQYRARSTRTSFQWLSWGPHETAGR